MHESEARARLDDARARIPTSEHGVLTGTFAIRHERGLDVVFLLDGAGSDFQIGMGAASDDFTSILSIGIDSQNGSLHATGSHTTAGRRRSVPVRVVHRSSTAIAVEATPLRLRDRPVSLKCWSFVRRGVEEHYSDIVGLVSPALERLPPVPLKTRPRG